MCYKECRAVTAVRVGRAIPLGGGEGTYLPLTIASWLYQGGALSGTARNDSARALSSARVAAADLGSCAWKEAVLLSRSLSPGQETTFTIDPYSSYCTGEHLLIVGQGRTP